jgi:hypothetical protein
MFPHARLIHAPGIPPRRDSSRSPKSGIHLNSALCAEMNDHIHPTEIEVEFLNLSFNRFLELFQEIMSDEFWDEKPNHRFFKTKDLFAVYTEILKYPPVQWVIDANKRPNHSDVGRDLFKFIRHILMHFPFFEKWDDVWIKQSLVNLYSRRPEFIDKFLTKNEGKGQLKYRFWEAEKKRMTYIAINFPKNYTREEKIFLREILPEKDGVKFSAIFMWGILKVQVEEIKDTEHTTIVSTGSPINPAPGET